MKVIFISGRISAPTYYEVWQNVLHAHQASLRLMKRGYATICPHKNTEFFEGALKKDPEDDFEEWIKRDMELLSRCDIIYLLKGWRQSRGSKREHARAKELNLDIMFEEEENRKKKN